MTNLADRLRAHATGFVHAHATERLLIEAAEALTPSPDHAELIGRLEEQADYEDRCADAVLDTNGAMLREAAAALRSLTASLSRVEARAQAAEAGLPGLLFSKRKALVEHCAQIVETFATNDDEDIDYSPAHTIKRIAAAVRDRGLSRASSTVDEGLNEQ